MYKNKNDKVKSWQKKPQKNEEHQKCTLLWSDNRIVNNVLNRTKISIVLLCFLGRATLMDGRTLGIIELLLTLIYK